MHFCAMMLFVTIIPGYLSTTTPENHYLHLATFSVRVNMDISHSHDKTCKLNIISCYLPVYLFHTTKQNTTKYLTLKSVGKDKRRRCMYNSSVFTDGESLLNKSLSCLFDMILTG